MTLKLSSKVEKSIQVVKETFVDMNEGSKIANLSPVYFRRNVEKLEEEEGNLKYDFFGKQVIERSLAVRIEEIVRSAKIEREKKSREKKNQKENKVQSGPTLLDLKYHAKKNSLKIGRLNKEDLVSLLKENNIVIEGFEDSESVEEN